MFPSRRQLGHFVPSRPPLYKLLFPCLLTAAYIPITQVTPRARPRATPINSNISSNISPPYSTLTGDLCYTTTAIDHHNIAHLRRSCAIIPARLISPLHPRQRSGLFLHLHTPCMRSLAIGRWDRRSADLLFRSWITTGNDAVGEQYSDHCGRAGLDGHQGRRRDLCVRSREHFKGLARRRNCFQAGRVDSTVPVRS